MSKFIRIKCPCGNEQTIFGSATTIVKCIICKTELAMPTGARIAIKEGVAVTKTFE
ncbi:MAG: hypothetical protein QXW70_03060 [Candidatus Anstonellales archaeon]